MHSLETAWKRDAKRLKLWQGHIGDKIAVWGGFCSSAWQGCCGDGLSSCTLTDLIPVGTRPAGDGRWGHSELAGNASEWTLDWNTPYPNPCVDCAQLTPATQRSTHGGAFFNEAFLVYSNRRGAYDPTTRQFGLGARCARAL